MINLISSRKNNLGIPMNNGSFVLIPIILLTMVLLFYCNFKINDTHPYENSTIFNQITTSFDVELKTVRWAPDNNNTGILRTFFIDGSDDYNNLITANVMLNYTFPKNITLTEVHGLMQLSFDGVIKKQESFNKQPNNASSIIIEALTTGEKEIKSWINGTYQNHLLTYNIISNSSFLVNLDQGSFTTINKVNNYSKSFQVRDSPRQILHCASIDQFDDPKARTHITQFNSLVRKPIYGIDRNIGQYPAGWGTDFNYLLGSETPFGLLPLFQDGMLKSISLVLRPCLNATDQQTLKNIVAGVEDNYIRTIANECKAFGYPIYMRFGAEFNIFQAGSYSWAANPTDFVDAWIYVYNLFKAQGVTNVIWVWNPNYANNLGDPHSLDEYYPGDSYVDWVGIDVYQWLTTSDPDQMIAPVYNTYGTRKPVAICEWGVNSYQWDGVNTPDSVRAAWMEKFFDAVEKRPNIQMISYFYWYYFNFNDKPLTREVYQRRIANSIYIGS